MLRMNRETGFHTSDTLVVVDSARRRRWIIAAGILIAVLAIALAAMMMRGSDDAAGGPEAGKEAGGPGGQVPTVTVVVPGRSQVARTVALRRVVPSTQKLVRMTSSSSRS